MALSPNYSWSEPDNSSLVKNGAADIRTLGDAIDTSVWNVGYGQAGKNKIINGDFSIWQRGTSITPASGYGYGADRFQTYSYGTSTSTLSQQTFTAGTAPVAGYEGTFFCRVNSTNTSSYLEQKIENVRTFAGQTVTVSFWAKSASNQTLTEHRLTQDFGVGGSAVVTTSLTNFAITTSWVRYSATVTLPSISGKTIGTSSCLTWNIKGAINNNLDIWGVQVEYGSKATPFQTATGTIQGELSAAQRYYYRTVVGGNESVYSAGGTGQSSTATAFFVPLPVPMRITPASIDFSTLSAADFVNAPTALTNLTLNANNSSRQIATVNGTSASGITQYRPYVLASTNTNGYVGFSAEL